jgi:hypothetical protein
VAGPSADEIIIDSIRPRVQYFPGESRKIVDFSESSEIFSQEAGRSPILRYDWGRRRHGADDDQNKEPAMTTATEYALDRLTRVLGFTTEEAIEILARRQAADDRVKAEIEAERAKAKN